MTDQQLKTIVGLVSGMQTAIVHLSGVVAAHNGISFGDLAASFEKTGESIPEGVQNRELVQLVLRQVAAGVRSPLGPPSDNVIYGLFDSTPAGD